MKSFRDLLAVGAFLFTCTSGMADEAELYFPLAEGKWETVKPADAGWDQQQLQKALDYAGKNQSSSVVVLYRGRILAEEHWQVHGARSVKYRRRIVGRDGRGGSIEDVASVQKSVASILVGIAQEKGLLKLDDPVVKYLKPGWTKATREQEKAITIRHLLTMTSGLSDDGKFVAGPGTRWRYNTWAYARTMDVVCKVAGMERNELTRKWLTEPLGMADSKWVRRGLPQAQSVNPYGFATTARDLARFGLMMLANGKWGKRTVLADQKYLAQATRSSQKMNPYYGYLWWVNRNGFVPKSSQLATAPMDMFSAKGALNRRCFVAPGLGLVVTRLGDQPVSGRRFDRQFWRLLMGARKAGR